MCKYYFNDFGVIVAANSFALDFFCADTEFDKIKVTQNVKRKVSIKFISPICRIISEYLTSSLFLP